MAAIALTILAIMSGCKKDDPDPTPVTPTADVTAPAITITGAENDAVEQFSSAIYFDAGATAYDAHDGSVSVHVTGSVNMNLANDYALVYTATDSAGNAATKTRTVKVDGAAFLSGSYTVTDYTGSTSNGSYPETITSTSGIHNRINFSKFAFYQNAAVYADVSGTTITVPTQTVYCGLAPNAMNHTFSGSGTYTNSTTFTINYTDVSTSGTFSCHGDYVHN